jgi:hypothetical protein
MKNETYVIKDENGKIIETFERPDWYDRVEEPLKELVKLLRNNGFNTLSSCGHRPNPYVLIYWGCIDTEITRLYLLLVENHYYNFRIDASWLTDEIIDKVMLDFGTPLRTLEIKFYTKKEEGLANIKEIKKEEKNYE